MQAVELMVFLIVSIIIASLIILFIGGIKPTEIYKTVEDLVFPKPIDVNSVTTVTKAGFAGKMGACWEECAFGAKNINCGTFYIKGEGLAEEEKKINAEGLQAIFEKYNYCTGCLVSVQPEEILLPAVASLKCESSQLVVSS